jgi:hypothetical protein
MAPYGSKDIGFFLLDGNDLLSLTLGLDDGEVEEMLDDITSLGISFPAFADVTTAKRSNMKVDWLYDDAAGLTKAVFIGQQGVSRVLVWNVDGNVVRGKFQGYAGAIEGKHGRQTTLDKLHRGMTELTPSGPGEDGTVLHLFQNETAAGNTQASSHDESTHVRARVMPIVSSSVANPSVLTFATPHGFTSGDKVLIAGHGGSTPSINGEQIVTVIDPLHVSIPVNVTVGGTLGTATQVSTQGGGAGYFACSTSVLGGYTNFQAKVKHSADNITFSDLVVFTPITTAPKAERIAIAAGTAILRYTAALWLWNGAGAAQSAKFFVGITRNELQ